MMYEKAVVSRTGAGILPIVALFTISLGLFSLNWLFFSGGVSTAAAERILSGQIPYRDFFTLYAPGSFYLLAFLLKVFGKHVLVEAVAASVICAAAICLCYLVVLRLQERRVPALVCALLLLSAIFSKGYYNAIGPYPETILLILLSLYCMVRYFQGERRFLLLAGLSTGVLIVFKHDVGGYTGLAMAAGIVAGHFAGPAVNGGDFRQLLYALLKYAAAAAIVAVPVAVYFAALAGPDMWWDLVVFPLTDFRFARPEAYPGVLPTGLYTPWRLGFLFNVTDYLKFLLPFVIMLLAVIFVVMSLLRRQRRHVAASVIFIIAYLFHYSSAHVQVNTNIISLWMYAVLLGAILYDQLDSWLSAARAVHFRRLMLVLACGWAAMMLIEPLYKTGNNWRDRTETYELPKISGTRASSRTYREVSYLADFVNRHVPPGQKIFLGLHRHDAVVVGYSRLYVALDRLNATRNDQLHPGVVDKRVTQEQIARDLEANHVEYIILQHIISDDKLDEIKARQSRQIPGSGATYLDEYIRQHYSMIDGIDRFEIWQRRPDVSGAQEQAGQGLVRASAVAPATP